MTALGEIFPQGPEAAVGSRSSTVLGTGDDDSPTKSRQPGQCTIHQGPKEKSFVACRGGLCRISILAGFAREILHSRWSRPRRDSQTTLVVQDRQPLPAVWLTIGAVVDKARFCTRHAEF